MARISLQYLDHLFERDSSCLRHPIAADDQANSIVLQGESNSRQNRPQDASRTRNYIWPIFLRSHCLHHFSNHLRDQVHLVHQWPHADLLYSYDSVLVHLSVLAVLHLYQDEQEKRQDKHLVKTVRSLCAAGIAGTFCDRRETEI